MDKELIKLLERLCDLADDELIGIVNNHPADYRPETTALARIVMARRGFTVNKGGKITDHRKDKGQNRKAQRPQTNSSVEGEGKQGAGHIQLDRGLIEIKCLRCNARLEYVGTRKLHEDRSLGVLGELGEMYRKGASEFLDVYVCGKCGRTELFVDGIGEDLRPQ